jgi:hypothetical protein
MAESSTDANVAAPIEAAAAEIAEEDEFATTDYDGSTVASMSVTSSIYQHSYENGRRVSSTASTWPDPMAYGNDAHSITNTDMDVTRFPMMMSSKTERA